jgi:hypothetical protein
MFQVWCCIISQREAVRRIVSRDGKTTVEAKAILESQLSNSSAVRESNVIFCTEWAEGFSQLQSEKAWGRLMEETIDPLTRKEGIHR